MLGQLNRILEIWSFSYSICIASKGRVSYHWNCCLSAQTST